MNSPKRTIDLRRNNRQTLLKSLFFHGSASRVALSQHSGLSPATVTNVVAELLEEGVVLETGLAESEGGRPRTILAVNPEFGYFVGVDLGETHVNLELFDLALHNRGAVRHILSAEDNAPEAYVAHIAAGLSELQARANPSGKPILGVGIGVPGVVERNPSVTVSAPIWDWQGVPLLDLLEQKISHPIFLDNGAKAMTLAESWFGAGRGIQNLAVILIGTGIGAGFITDGTLYRGATNSAGEWGHTTIVLDGRACRCGSQGCLEAYAGAPGLRATLGELSADSPLLAFENQLSFVNQLSGAIEQGDTAALALISTTAHYLGAGVANLINLFNPERILIGGWVGMQIGKAILPELTQYASRYSLPPALRPVQIDLCQFGQDAICMGAACLALAEFLAGNYPDFRSL